jgi:hypothetical protein
MISEQIQSSERCELAVGVGQRAAEFMIVLQVESFERFKLAIGVG